jgi:hypothetical protein
MRIPSRLAKALLPCLVLHFVLLASAQAQILPDRPGVPAGRPRVVMENVFFNVVWGSAFGATLGVATSILGSADRSAPSNVRDGAFSGATAGGIIGLGLALYLVYQGISFDPAASSFSTYTGSVDPSRPGRATQALDPPFVLIVSADNPNRVTGFSARVFELRF